MRIKLLNEDPKNLFYRLGEARRWRVERNEAWTKGWSVATSAFDQIERYYLPVTSRDAIRSGSN